MKTTTAGESSIQAAAPVREAAERKRSPATTPPKPRKVRRVSEKDMDISLTVGVPGEDINGVTSDRLALYVEEKARMGIIAMERGDSHLQLHIQGFKWLSMPHMSRLQAELLWKACVAHELVSISDVDHIFFGTTDSPRYYLEQEEPKFYPDVKFVGEKVDKLGTDQKQQWEHAAGAKNPTQERCKGKETEEVKSEIKTKDILRNPEPHSNDDEAIGDIIKLDKVQLPGDDVDKLLSDLRNEEPDDIQKEQSVEEIPPIDLEQLEVDTVDIELLLSDRQRIQEQAEDYCSWDGRHRCSPRLHPVV
ncbi:hypothetical protein R1sor_019906 [Riccia sorocarpa]|uniref:Uncharacterized protein n=1 Tax=Riccia sorocarpa TaxID=122646 RepID=A0ABD3IK33_9MARC